MYLEARHAATLGNTEAAQRLMYHLLDVKNDGVADLEELTLWVGIMQVRARVCLIETVGIRV